MRSDNWIMHNLKISINFNFGLISWGDFKISMFLVLSHIKAPKLNNYTIKQNLFKKNIILQ